MTQELIDWMIENGVDIQSAYCRGGRHSQCPVLCNCVCHQATREGEKTP